MKIIKAPPKTTILTVGKLRKKLRRLKASAHIVKWSDIYGEYTTAYETVELGKGKELKGLEIQFL